MNNTYTHLHIIFQIAQIFSLPTPWAFSSISTQTPPQKKKNSANEKRDDGRVEPLKQQGRSLQQPRLAFLGSWRSRAGRLRKTKTLKKKERWEWSVWCVHRKVWKKSRGKKKHFCLTVLIFFFVGIRWFGWFVFLLAPFLSWKRWFLVDPQASSKQKKQKL